MRTTTIPGASRGARSFDIVEEFWSPDVFTEAYSCAGREAELTRRFEHEFLHFTGLCGEAAFLSSGRKALEYLLGEIVDRRRTEVVLPAFCCDVVAKAVLDAGKHPVLVDSGPVPGSIDLAQCESVIRRGSILAVLLPHLYGLPVDFRPLAKSAREHGVLVIEDCTQTLGAFHAGKPLGSIGDASIHSFNVFKPVCLAGGGMLVVNEAALDELPLRSIRQRNQPPARDAELADVAAFERALIDRRADLAERCGASVKSRMRRGARRLPKPVRSTLRRLVNRFRTPVARGVLPTPAAVGSVRAAAGLWSLERFPEISARRHSNLEFLADRLKPSPQCRVLLPAADASARPLFAKIMVEPGAEPRIRRLEERLLDEGFVGGRFHYDRTIDQQPKIGSECTVAGSLANAHRAAACSIDLPIHQNMAPEDLKRMADIVTEVLGR